MTEALIAELLERKSFLLFFLRDPKLDPLRRDRRFKETLERLRLPE